MVFLQRITYANFLYALALRLRGPVAAWRIQLPSLLARPFDLLRPHQLFSRDEWILLHDTCLDSWRDRVLPGVMRTQRCSAEVGGITVDFNRNAWQILSQEFERLYLFVATVQRASGNAAARILTPWIALAIGEDALRKEFPRARFHRSWLNELAERIYEWGLSAAHFGRAALQLLRSLAQARIDVGPRRIQWTGISAQEIPSEADKLHFGWAAAYGHVPPQEVLYFLPGRLDARQGRFLAQQRIACIAPDDAFRLLPLVERIKVLAAAAGAILRGLFLDNGTIGPLRARFMARAPLWLALARRLGSRTYVTSTSSSWPERPEVAALQAAGLRTVIWSYSANTLWFARSAAAFRDASVIRSIVISDEFWVWNGAVRRYYERRRATEDVPFPRLQVTGAMMCGNAANFSLSRPEARRRLGLPEQGFLVSIFDVPTINEAWRQRFGGGPVTIEPEFGEAFFEGLRRMLEAFPSVNLMLKLKRRIGESYREFPQALFGLIAAEGPWIRGGRIHLVDVNCDPYLPIAAGDASLGMPCTSPVLVALASGRPAAYFDPLQLVGHSPEAGLRTLALQSQEALHAAVAAWLGGSAPRGAASPELALGPVWRDNPRLFEFSGGQNPHA